MSSTSAGTSGSIPIRATPGADEADGPRAPQPISDRLAAVLVEHADDMVYSAGREIAKLVPEIRALEVSYQNVAWLLERVERKMQASHVPAPNGPLNRMRDYLGLGL